MNDEQLEYLHRKAATLEALLATKPEGFTPREANLLADVTALLAHIEALQAERDAARNETLSNSELNTFDRSLLQSLQDGCTLVFMGDHYVLIKEACEVGRISAQIIDGLQKSGFLSNRCRLTKYGYAALRSASNPTESEES